MAELKGQAYRDEAHLHICGRSPDEVSKSTILGIGRRWLNQPTIMVFDQNIDFGHTIVLGTELCKALRDDGFTGIILIRSGNDSASNEREYVECGADGMLPKTSKIAVLVPEILVWRDVAIERAATQRSLGSGSPDAGLGAC